MSVHSEQQAFWERSGVFFKESYYEMSLSVALHTRQQFMFTDDWGLRFFGSVSDATASVLAYISLLLLVVLPIHSVLLMICTKDKVKRH